MWGSGDPVSDDNVNEVRFRGQGVRQERTPPPGYENLGGEFVSPKFRAFIEAAMEGRLPPADKVAEQDPRVVALAQELMVVHLPEWFTPGGRKIAAPTSMQIGGAIRVAEYLIARGVRFDPDAAVVRWVPTPGVPAGAGDLGTHIYRLEDGSWPETPDAEQFWDVADIEVKQLDNGQWCAFHPRGIECTDASKTEAFAMCTERVRAKVTALKEDS